MTLYLGTLVAGCSVGFSAVAIPDILDQQQQEKGQGQNGTFLIQPVVATEAQLDWFGEILRRLQDVLTKTYNLNKRQNWGLLYLGVG